MLLNAVFGFAAFVARIRRREASGVPALTRKPGFVVLWSTTLSSAFGIVEMTFAVVLAA